MVVLNKIYTRTGDDGTTGLGTGERRKKYDLRVAAYGTLDEVNAALGIARLHAAGEAALDRSLSRIQNDLFDVGADLCTPGKGKGPGGARLTVTAAQVAWLEAEIDRLNAELAPLKSFVLPGGSAAAVMRSPFLENGQSSPNSNRRRIPTPKGSHPKAQGRAAHPGIICCGFSTLKGLHQPGSFTLIKPFQGK